MANVKIDDLVAITDPASTDVLPIVDLLADVTKKVSIENILKNAANGTAAAPSLTFDTDQTTGIFLESVSELGFSTNGVGRLYIDENGNVGIGTATPTQTLDVVGTGSFSAGPLTVGGFNVVTVGDTGTVTSTMILDGTIVDADINANAEIAVSKLANGTARQLLQTDAAGTGVEFTSNVDVPGTLDVTGVAVFDANVGIGTSSPAEKLDVAGNIQIADNGSISTNAGDLRISADTSNTNTSATDIFFQIEGSDLARFRSGALQFYPDHPAATNGVGVCTTSTTDSLRLSGGANILNNGINLVLRGGSTTSPTTAYRMRWNTQNLFDYNASVDAHVWYANNSEAMRLDTSGNVGIGTSDPTQKMDLEGSSGARIAFTDTGDRRYSVGNAGTSLTIRDESASTDRIAIDSVGRVGIGTSSPASTLDVYKSSDGEYFRCGSSDTNRQLVFSSSNTLFDGDTHTINAGSNAGRLILATADIDRMIIDSNGNVGIGTSNPTGKLEIAGNSASQLIKYGDGTTTGYFVSQTDVNRATADAAIHIHDFRWNGTPVAKIKALTGDDIINKDNGYLTFETSNGAGTGERMRIDSSGNVGIGTSSPDSPIHITATNPAVTLTDSDSLNTPSSLIAGSGGNLFYYADRFNSGTGGAHTWYSNGGVTESMTLTGNGRVGIGTSSPAQLLTLDGDNPQFGIADGLGNYSTIGVSKGGGTQGNLIISTSTDADALVFQRGATETIRIDSAGNVGIGTSSPTEKLTVDGNIEFESSNQAIKFAAGNSATNSIECNSGSGPRASIDFLGVGTSQTTDIVFKTAETSSTSAERMRIKTSSGNVGIGTNNPTSKLTVNESGAEAILSLDRTDASTAGILLVGSGNNANFITGGGVKDLFIATNNIERMRIDSDGNVGIGTSSPSKKLHVLATANSGILVEDTSASSGSPDIEVIGKRNDGNTSPAFGGKLLLAANRTDAAVQGNKSVGTVLFGGNHTDGSTSNILYTASIGGIAEGTFNSSTDMPTGLAFYTGSTGTTSVTANTKFGTERMRIDSDGNVGIGTSNPGYMLDVTEDGGDTIVGRFNNTGNTSAYMTVQASGTTLGAVRFGATGDDMSLWTGSSETMRLVSGGNVGIGTSSPNTNLEVKGDILAGANSTFGQISAPNHLGTAINASIQVNSQGDGSPSISLNHARSNSLGSSYFAFNKAYGNFTTPTIVGDNADIGALVFNGFDGTNYIRAAQISVNVDGTPGTNDMPGRLRFLTTADGASSPTERMRIDSSGNVGIGTSNPGANLDINGDLKVGPETGVAEVYTDLPELRIGSDRNDNNTVSTTTFYVDNTEKVRIDTSGNVGIGTSSPGEKLEVNGTIKATDINFTGLATYADDTAAGTGGLVAGDVYKTSTGELRIKL